STTRSRRTRNPDPRKTKPHAHKNVGFVSSLNRPLRAVFFRFFRPVVRFAPGLGARSYNRRQARVASRHSFDIHTNQSKDKEQTWRFATTSS
ncbi:hypothetical protein, partial [Burkholderia pseudomallei]|uniref:hypothetical protein n=1 Tax=Burkholderia pseudomallei TaxID=28450 RepID=UPI0022D1CC7E